MRQPPIAPPKKKPPAGKPPGPSEISTGLAPPPARKTPPSAPQGRPPRPSEVSTGVQPSFTGPPIPFLQQYGYSGSIQDANARLRSITDAYQQRFGTVPSWGHVFNVLVSPAEDFKDLYAQVPRSNTEARLQSSLAQDRKERPYEYYVRDQNGNLQWNTALGELINKQQPEPTPGQLAVAKNEVEQARNQRLGTPQAQQGRFNKLAKAHPWVPTQSGFLPVNDFLGFMHAVEKTQKEGFPQDLQVGGQSLDQVQKQLDIATKQAVASGSASGIEQLGQAYGQEKKLHSVLTIKQGQQELQHVSPEFFGDLQAGGYMTSDWAKRLKQWQSTADYFRRSTQKLASENGFGDRTDVFIKAWKGKQQALKGNPFAANLIRNIPLQWFATNAVKPGFGGNKLPGLRFAMFGPHRSGWHLITPSGIFTGLTNTAKLGFDVAAGSFQQTEADAAFTTTYMRSVTESAWKPGQTEESARKSAMKQLEASPSALRIAAAGSLPEHPTGKLAAFNAISELAFDIAISSPRITGIKVKPGDLGAVKSNTYFQAKIPWAYNALKKGDLGGAVKSLGGTRGAEKLAVKTQDFIRSGHLSQDQFEHMASEMYAHGKTVYGEGEIHGDVFPELKSYSLPKPGPAGQIVGEGWLHAKRALDHFEEGLHSSGLYGTDNAANFLSFARTLFSRAAPTGETRYLFADKTPEDIYNFTVKSFRDAPEVKDSRKLAEQWRDEFITARANDNVRGMLSVQEKLRKLYYKTHPDLERGKPGITPETLGPQLLAEGPTYFHFPAKQFKEITPDSGVFEKLAYAAQRLNTRLNKLGARHRQIVVSGFPFGGFSLGYKHAVADTARRLVGGGGPLFGATKETKEAKAFLGEWFKQHPSDMRTLGVEQSSAKLGEYRYMVRLGTTSPKKFSTGEWFGKRAEDQYLQAAGGDMRHLLTDDALTAYAQSSKEDLTPLLRHVQRDPFHRQAWLSSEAYQEQLAILKGETPLMTGEELPDMIRQLPKDHPSRKLLEEGGKGKGAPLTPEELGGAKEAPLDAVAELRRQVATAYAEEIHNRYKNLEEALGKAGTDLNAASAVMRGNIGAKADKALAKFIKENKIDYEVREGLVTQKQFDDVMQRWVGVLMTANKWNRGKMFDHVFHTTFAELKDAGWEVPDAIQASALIARRQTVYHMLDFSNMLQVEQNLRWMSYFATKHRLYWTWIAKTFWKKPALASAIKQVSQHLQNGNLYFTVNGHKMFVPAGRLVWVNSQEYPETSPPLQFAYGAYKGWRKGEDPVAAGLGSLKATSGNVITRSDQSILMWLKLARIETGGAATYAGAVHDMSASQRQDFNRRYNAFQLHYFHDHGVYPSEREAVKHTLLASALMETQRANMFVPVMPSEGRPDKINNLFQEFGKIINPAKKRAFLDKHPELQDYMGLSQDPLLKQHNDQLWAKYQSATEAYNQAENKVLEKVTTSGLFTADTANELKHISDTRSKVIQQLKDEDAAWRGSPGYPKKKGEPGLWTKQLEGDPLATRGIVARMFPHLEKGQLKQGTIGETVEDLTKTKELLLKRQQEPAYASKDSQDAIRTLLTDINQKIAVFYGTSKSPLPQAESEYYGKHVTPYIRARDRKKNEINAETDPQSGGLVLNPKTGTYEYKPSLDRLETEFRAWRDEHDHPVVIKINGKEVKFPSPVRMGWLRLPPDIKKQALAQLAGDSYEHIADYEKHLLGFKTVKGESDGWLAYTKILDLYDRQAALQGQSITSKQKEYIAKLVQQGVPGYSKPHPDFMKAYRFAQKPKYQRVQQTTIIKDSPYQEQWHTILKTSDYFWRGIQRGAPQRQTQAVYREYMNGPQFQSWLNEQPNGFKKELSLFGPNFLNTLTS